MSLNGSEQALPISKESSYKTNHSNVNDNALHLKDFTVIQILGTGNFGLVKLVQYAKD